MVTRGHSIDSIRALPLRHRLAVWRLLAAGADGWLCEAAHQHQTYSVLANLLTVVVTAFGGRRGRVAGFAEAHPLVAKMLRPQAGAQAGLEKWRGAAK